MSTSFACFLTAIDAEDDDHAEATVPQLTGGDEPLLIALLATSGSADRRWWAARALAAHGAADAVPALVTAFGDDDEGVRAAACMAVAHLYPRQPEVVGAVLDQVATLLTDEDGMVRQAATDTLTVCGDDAVAVLAATLEGGHQGARTRAMMALRKIATFPAAKIMFQYLNDSNYLVHTYAYEGLDEMGLIENVLLLP